MAVNLRGSSLLSLRDLSREAIMQIFQTTEYLKRKQQIGEPHPLLAGKTLGMIFQKASTRTRVSFEVGMYQLGGHALNLSGNELQLNRGETIADTARVLSRYVDGIMARVFAHQDVADLAHYGSVPVINGLSDFSHPCQGLTDYFTIYEKMGRLRGLKLAYVGDGNNVAHSLLFGGARLGVHVAIATPPGYEVQAEAREAALADAQLGGAKLTFGTDPAAAVQGADVIYTDVWTSMGQEAEKAKRLQDFGAFQVNAALMARANADAVFMHCLPAHRGEEVMDEVADSPQSVIFDQAENRLHVQKAVLALLMG